MSTTNDQNGTSNYTAGSPIVHEQDLYAYWMSLGGSAAYEEGTIDIAAVDQFLSQCTLEKINAALKKGAWQHEPIMVEETEITGYVSVIASRLPKLRKLRIYGLGKESPWPFDFEMIGAAPAPFPKLKHIGLISSHWTEELVEGLENGIPSLETPGFLLSRLCGIGVYSGSGPTMSEAQAKAFLKRHKKVEFLG